MALPESYLLKNSAVPEYFDAIRNAEAPNKFTQKFLESLDFKSVNDRLLLRVLKDLNFIDGAGVPTPTYYEFLDPAQSKRVLGRAIRSTFADLFAVNKTAETMKGSEVAGKLRTLFAGTKKDFAIERIANTFVALCNYADMTVGEAASESRAKKKLAEDESDSVTKAAETTPASAGGAHETSVNRTGNGSSALTMHSLQYHINIVLPDSKNPEVFDAIFQALRKHLG